MNILHQLRNLIKIKSLWLYLYLLKAVISFLLILPFYMTFNSYLAPSLYAKTLTNSWDMSVIVELLGHSGEFIPGFIMTIIIGAIIFITIIQFINGGLYYVIVSGKYSEINWREFFAECGVNFGTHIKITLLMSVIYLVLIPAGLFFTNIIGMAGGHLIGKAALFLSLFRLVIMFLILLAVSVFSDVMRAATTADVLKIASDYFRPRMFKLTGLFIVTWLPFFLVWLVVESLALVVIGLSLGIIGITIEFILFQISAVTRTGQKLWYLIILGHNFRMLNPGRFIPEQVELNFDNK